MDSLRSLASPTGFVTRSGETKQIPAKHIVPGDIVHIKMGDVVPADIRLFQCVLPPYLISSSPDTAHSVSNLEVDEALLTGEAMPVAKIVESLGHAAEITLLGDVKKPEVSRYSTVDTTDDRTLKSREETREQIAVGDRINMAFASTTVTRGRGSGIVVATGMDTQVSLPSYLPKLLQLNIACRSVTLPNLCRRRRKRSTPKVKNFRFGSVSTKVSRLSCAYSIVQ
jgi:P-type Na+/K+ transporter